MMKKLDVYLADLLIGNIKLHNVHWNVRGKTFKAVHEYLDDLYEETFEYYDEVAELQKQLGHSPKASAKEYLELTTVKERETKDIEELEAIEVARDLFQSLKETAMDVRKACDDENDEFLIANLMEDHIAYYTKELWFMNSMLK